VPVVVPVALGAAPPPHPALAVAIAVKIKRSGRNTRAAYHPCLGSRATITTASA